MDADLLSLCRRLIATPSVTTAGTREIVRFCAEQVLAPAGIVAHSLPSQRHGPEQVNLVAHVEGRNRDAAPIVLNTHMDTVPPGDPALWTECAGNPFAATVAGERIYGLGAADTKLDFAAKATALIQCGRPARDVWLVCTFGEERGLVGAKEIAEAGIVPRGAIALVGEPSWLHVITAHKGLMAFELTLGFDPIRTRNSFPAERTVFTGKAAHSSTPALGENAIVKALVALASGSGIRVAAIDGGDAVNKVPARCEVLAVVDPAARVDKANGRSERAQTIIPASALAALASFVRELQAVADRAGPQEPDYAAPTLTCNPGVIRTREDAIALEFELRPPPSLALDAVRAGVAQVVERTFDSSPGMRATLLEKRANPGFRSPGASETVELALAALAKAGLPLDTGVKAGCTEAGIYAAAGMEPIVFGPGPSVGVIHAPNEYNLLPQVESAVRFYSAILRG